LLWVIPYGIASAVLALLYFRFVWQLPRVTRARFIVAGLLFVGGALGFEMLSAIAADRSGYAPGGGDGRPGPAFLPAGTLKQPTVL
jgi:hypothetical protein